jgi:hypothetical protein
MVTAKNSRKRFAAASATIAGTTMDVAIARDILGGLAAGTTVSSWLGFGSVSDKGSG